MLSSSAQPTDSPLSAAETADPESPRENAKLHLLPSPNAPLYHRPYRDVPWLFLYGFCFGLWTLISIILAATSQSSPIPSIPHYIPKKLWETVATSAGPIIIATTFCSVLGLIWLYALLTRAKDMMKFTLMSVPIGLLTLSIITFKVALNSDNTEYLTLNGGFQKHLTFVVSLITFGLSILTSWYIKHKKDHFNRSLDIIQLSCDVLKSNPSIFSVVLLIGLSQAAFTILWLWFFTGTLHSGANQQMIVPILGNMDGLFLWCLAFSLFMFFWTSAVFQNLEKVTIAGVVGEWYFYERAVEDSSRTMTSSAWRHFQIATSTSFGSVCFASLIMGLVTFIRWSLNFIKRNSSRPARLTISCLFAPLDFIFRLIEVWTPFTMIQVGISGEDLITASRDCASLLRRNLILNLTSATLPRILLFLGNLAVSSASGAIVGVIATNALDSPYAYFAGTLATIIPFYILRVISSILITTMDATFICYVQDLDTNSCHLPAAHRIFS